MQNKVLKGQVYEICEIYIDDVLIHGKSDPEFLTYTRRVFDRLRDKKVAVNPRKTELDLEEDECVIYLMGHLIYSREVPEGLTSLTFSNPRLKRKCSNSWGSRITSELMCRT